MTRKPAEVEKKRKWIKMMNAKMKENAREHCMYCQGYLDELDAKDAEIERLKLEYARFRAKYAPQGWGS